MLAPKSKKVEYQDEVEKREVKVECKWMQVDASRCKWMRVADVLALKNNQQSRIPRDVQGTGTLPIRAQGPGADIFFSMKSIILKIKDYIYDYIYLYLF